MPRLIILAKNSSVRQVNIAGPVTTIGRADSNKLCIDSERVSRHHAAIEQVGDRFVLTDMGSRNGTYVNNKKVRSIVLANGDAITIGDCQIRFLQSIRPVPTATALRLLTIPADIERLSAYGLRSGAQGRNRPAAGH